MWMAKLARWHRLWVVYDAIRCALSVREWWQRRARRVHGGMSSCHAGHIRALGSTAAAHPRNEAAIVDVTERTSRLCGGHGSCHMYAGDGCEPWSLDLPGACS